MDHDDDYDLSTEIEEARHEAFIHSCARRDWEQGIRPDYTEDDNNE
jgi:hypothetical protein